MARLRSEIKKKRFGWVAILTVLALVLGLFGLSLGTPATAATGFDGSNFFPGDGKLDVDPNATNSFSVTRVQDKPSGNQDDTYAGDGAAEPALCPSVDTTHAAPQKSDITNFYYGMDSEAPGVLYLAWDRKFAGGTLAIDFEFNQQKTQCAGGINPTRTQGDLMVIYEFDGGTSSTVQVRIWDGAAWGAPLTGPPLLAQQSSISKPDLLFGELAVDLSDPAFNILDPAECDAFAMGWAKSRTGNSFDTSKVKDFVAPVQLNVSNCGKLTITKDARPNSTDSFGFTGSGTGPHADDVPQTFSLVDDTDTSPTRSTTFLAHPQTVTITEDDASAAGWSLDSIDCGTATVTKSVADRNVSIALKSGDDVTCTFVNTKPNTLTIVKDASPDNQRDFAFTATGTGVAASFELDDDVNDANVSAADKLALPRSRVFPNLAAGTYTVTETAAPGWTLTSVTCVNGTGTVVGRTLTVVLTNGQSPTCTFLNTKTPPTIVTTKTAAPTSVPEPGADVTFSVVVENTSPLAVTLTDLDDEVAGVVTDITVIGGAIKRTTCEVTTKDKAITIAAGASYSCEFVAFVGGNAQAKTPHVDTVTAQGKDSDGVHVEDDDDASVAITDVLPVIAVTKTPSAPVVHKGDTVTYTYVVTNTGVEEVTLTTSDDKCSPITGPLAGEDKDADTKLDVNETWTLSCSTALTATTKNVITVTGTDDEGNPSIKTAEATVTVLDPAINVTKTPSATVVHAGDTVTYTYVVTNPGNTPLATVTVVDDKCATVTGPAAGGDVDSDGKLGVGEAWTYSCTSALTATTTNTATASGADSLGKTVTKEAKATVAVITPAIAIDKAPSATSVTPGTTVVYTYTVTNPGDVPLTAVTVVDDKCSPVSLVSGDTNGDGLLQVTETWVYRCSQVQTGSLDTLTNVGTSTGTDPLGLVVTATDKVTVAVVAPLVIAQPTPQGVVLPAPAPAPTPVAAAPATLPRTGMDVDGWIQLGGSLILLGLSLLITARHRRRTA